MENREIILPEAEKKAIDETGYSAMVRLSETDRKYAVEFSEGIDVTDTKMILQYGLAAQKKVTGFTDRSLFDLPQHDYDEIKDDLNKLRKKIVSFEKEALSGADLYQNSEKAYASFKTSLERCSSQVNETARRLEIHRSSLLRHYDRLESHYETCMNYIREYDMYIYAGEICLKKSREEDLNALLDRAKASGLKEDTLNAEDYAAGCARLERRLSDLSLSRQLPYQLCTEIRIMQNTDVVIAQNLQSLYTNAFPLWKSRAVLCMGTGTERVFDAAMLKETDAALLGACDAIIQAISLNTEKQKKGIFGS